MTPTVSSPPSYWSRKDGKIGTILPFVVIAAIVFFFGGPIGTFILGAFENLFHLLIVGTGILATGWVLFDPKFRMAAFYIYRSVLRSIVGFFIAIDPISILKTYKERMEGKLKDMFTSLAELKQQKVKKERLIAVKKLELEKEVHLVQAAQQMGDVRNETLEKRQVVRVQTELDRYTGDLNRIVLLYTVLNRYYGLCQDTVTDMDREITFRSNEADDARASRNVTRNAMAILQGLPEKEMWDQGIDALEKQYTAAIGEVESFLDVTKDILAKADLQGGADAAKAMEVIDQWQRNNSSVALGGIGNTVSKSDIIQDANRQVSAGGAPAALKSKPNYDVKRTDSDDEYLRMVK